MGSRSDRTTVLTMSNTSSVLQLRLTTPADIETLFQQQLDEATNLMAGTKPRTREMFQSTWDGIFANLNDPAQRNSPTLVVPRVMIVQGERGEEIVGTINRFHRDEKNFVGYFVARPYWGKGFATLALSLMIQELDRLPNPRPLYANVIATNTASIKVLTKNNFRYVNTTFEGETERFLAGNVDHFILE